MRVFLADDEDLELFGIEKMLSDMPLELEICGTARNGEEGLRRILELCPDVVISDVKMPKLDGVAMTRRLREQGFSGEIVFISGYQDFSCAREAVSLGAREYMLKPVNRMELERLLSLLAGEELPVKSPAEREFLPGADMQREVVRRLLSGDWQEEDGLLKKAAGAGLYLESGEYAVMAADCGRIPEQGLEIAEHLRSRYGCSSGVLTEEGILTLIFCFSSILKEEAVMAHLIDCGEELLRELQLACEGEYCVGFSELSSSPLQMGALLLQASSALQECFHMGYGKVFFFEEAVAEKEENDLSIYADEVISVLAAGDREKVREFSDRVFNAFGKRQSRESILGTAIEIIASAVMAVRKRVAPAASGISTHAEYTRLLQLKTKEEIKAHLEGVLNTLMDLAFAQKSNSSKSAAEQIKEIVDREYQKDLSVEEIAERIHFSPSYTRRVFKNKMGVTILDYLQSVRMEKARGYLLSPEYKVYEIGNLVGYENPSYFNLVFRKYYGVAPGAFREQYWGSKK